MTIVAEGTAEQIEAYFETKLADYEVGDETLRLASSSLSAPTSVAPLIRALKSSHTETSKLNGVFCRKRSPFLIAKCSRIHSNRLTTARCSLKSAPRPGFTACYTT